jgi:CRISPR-associated protein Csh1
MLRALRDIGLISKLSKESDIPIYDPVKADHVIVLNFNANGDFVSLGLEEFSRDKLGLYMYKKPKGKNPPGLTPTILLNKSDFSKSLDNIKKILKYYKGIAGIPKIEIKDDIILNSIKKIMEQHRLKKNKVLLTIKIKNKYIGEIEAFKKRLEELIYQEGSEGKSKGVCSVCMQEKEISGNISPFKFYTIDKPGYIVGGFKKEISYKNFPLCYDCKREISIGFHKIQESLKFKIGKGNGIDYYLIPDFILGKDEVKEIILKILSASRKEGDFSERDYNSLMSEEEEILYVLSKEKDIISLNFLFLKEINSEQVILLHLQDIYPSRLKQLFTIKKYIEDFFSSGDYRYRFTYNTIYEFFRESRFFLEIVDKTFRGYKIEEKFLIPFLLDSIRKSVFNNGDYIRVIRDAFAVFLFVKISTREVVMEDKEIKEVKDIEEFLDSIPVLDSPVKKGLFLLGALTESILQIQQKERGSKPFLKKLKGFKMNQTEIMGLFSDIRDKLESYEKYYGHNKELFIKAFKYLTSADTNWKLNVEQINFYFLAGMARFHEIKDLIYKSKSNVEDKDGEEDSEEQA